MKVSNALLTIALMAGSAHAQLISTSISTSKSSLKKSTLKKIIESTNFSYYGSLTKKNALQEDQKTGLYQQLTASYSINDDASIFFVPRFNIQINNQGNDNETNDWLNPRMGLRAFSYSNGNYSFSPELRLEVAMNDTSGADPDTHYAIARISQSSSYQMTNALNLCFWAGLYENVVNNNASKGDKFNNSAIFDIAARYSLNDQHSMSLNYEMVSNFDSNSVGKSDFYTNKESGNTFYLKYANSQIKNVTIIPGTYISRSQELDTENLGLSLELVGRL